MDPIVSIIVPAYNYAGCLPRAIDSVTNQEGVQAEIIIVDDGSTDETWGILQRYTPRIRAIRQTNAGVSAARNRGIVEARGRFIAFLDPDDLYHPQKLIRQITLLESRPECGWTYCDCIFQEEASGLSRPFSQQYRYHTRLALEGPLLFEALVPSNFIPVLTPLVRRPCLDRAGVFDERFAGIEDFDLMLRLAATAPAVYLPETLATYVYHGGSLSHNRARVDRDKYFILDKIATLYPERVRRFGPAARQALADMNNWFGYRAREARSWGEATGRFRQSVTLWPIQGRAWLYLAASAARLPFRL